MSRRGAEESRQFLFASYAREDAALVRLVTHAVQKELTLRSSDLSVWIDREQLQPGSSFLKTIQDALKTSVGLLAFVSSASVESPWVREEFSFAIGRALIVIPIFLEPVAVPPHLRFIQGVDLSRDRSPVAIARAAVEIVDAVLGRAVPFERNVRSVRTDTTRLAEGIAAEIQKPSGPRQDQPPQSVFVVHGHDKTALAAIVSYLREAGIEPVLLSEVDGPAQSLFQKFLQISTAARFAIVLFSADDIGAPRAQYELDGVADRALQFRPRQNVVLELGFFYGHLGWDKVFVVLKKPDKLFPNFERPSDLDGVVFDELDEQGKWRASLGRKLREAGFLIE